MTSRPRGKEGKPKNRAEDKFNPSTLDRAVIALPLLAEMKRKKDSKRGNEDEDPRIWVIIDTHHLYPDGREIARERIKEFVRATADESALDEAKNKYSRQYVFARLLPAQIRALANLALSEREGEAAAIYKIWLDHDVERLTNKSVSTVKADAARNAFSAFGSGIVWAVLDSGIDGAHPHFRSADGEPATLKLEKPLRHRDFTDISNDEDESEKRALEDELGHGTHVAGIIAGQYERKQEGGIVAQMKRLTPDGKSGEDQDDSIPAMRGMAPHTKLLSLKVLDKQGGGRASNLIAALEYIQDLNASGRNILVHGVNMSVGYSFEPNWFACGQSPLCVEVNRLVRTGVVVVVAAGNTGYGYNQPAASGPRAAGLDITINDPGNAELAITVGSTHRDMPHVYGVSFFSSKGPTGDGRMKPDIVAPGEKILSCESAQKQSAAGQKRDKEAYYVEDSGTSMAAPHVSGVIASFLSIRREFIGEPLRVKEIFLDNATDLKRAVYFQGRGLVDLMRTIQSV